MLEKVFDRLRVRNALVFGKGAKLKATSTTGVVTEIDMAELAAVNDIAASDLAKIDGITNGTVAAGKAAVPDSNKDLAALRNLTVTNLDAGASGTAGTVDVFPTTASKGKVSLSCTDQTGDTTVSLVVGAMAAARTITLADPLANANIVTDTGIGGSVTAKVTTQFDAVTGTTGTTLTDVVGAVITVVPGTYRYRVHVAGTSTANSGMKLSFKYTTTALSSAENTTRAYTASAVAVTHNTTATDQPALLAATTAYINVEIEGTMVVTTGGTIKLQAAQNAAHVDTTSVYVGSYMAFSRIA